MREAIAIGLMTVAVTLVVAASVDTLPANPLVSQRQAQSHRRAEGWLCTLAIILAFFAGKML
jgi:hypothetical protein